MSLEDSTMGEAPSAGVLEVPDLGQKLLSALQSATEPVKFGISTLLGAGSAADESILEAFHNALDPVKIGICTMLGIRSAEGQTQEVSTDGKRKQSSGPFQGPRAKRARTSALRSVPRPIDFEAVKNPYYNIWCLLQVNKGELAGSLRSVNEGHSFRLFLDGGSGRAPSICLQFKYPGSDGFEVGRVTWGVDSRAMGRWVIQELEYILVAEAPHDSGAYHRNAINQCEGVESTKRLMCITLKLTGYAGGSCRKDSKEPSQAIRTCINAIFLGKNDYTLRIWFIIPRPNIADIDSRCLAVMRNLLEQRQDPLSRAQDANGVYFSDAVKNASVPGQPKSTQARQGFGYLPGVDQNTQAAEQAGNDWDPYANRAVPSFGLDLPVVPIQTRPVRNLNPKTWGPPKSTLNPETQPRSPDTASTMAAKLPQMGTKTTFTAGPLVAPSLPKRSPSDDEDEDGEIKEGEELATVASPSIAEASESTAELTLQANLQLIGSIEVQSAERDGGGDKEGVGDEVGEAEGEGDEDEDEDEDDDPFAGISGMSLLNKGDLVIDEGEKARYQHKDY